MKRSEINQYLEEAITFFDSHQFYLPKWAKFSLEDWKKLSSCQEVIDVQLGWDITSFGTDDFFNCGLTLFTLRNGGANYEKSYAEKIMMVRNKQVTPRHFHWFKNEDIINRGGGNLIIELYHADPTSNKLTGEDFDISVDGCNIKMKSGEKLILKVGESVTLNPCHAHTFYGDGDCLIGEVSKVNDDDNDNCFIDGTPRFDHIEEDSTCKYLLSRDYKKYLN